MLKSINNILRTMGEALTFANTGEMLTEKQKNSVLAPQLQQQTMTTDAMLSQKTLAGDEEFSTEAVNCSIALCRS